MLIDEEESLHSTLSIIPARGGSRGLSRKNLRLLHGKPLLSYSVEAALSAKRVTYAVVATDDEDIAEYARSIGIAVVRSPSHLSVDGAPTFPVIKWALHHLAERGRRYDVCVMMRATTPFRTAVDVDAALKMFFERPDADSTVSVTELVGGHPRRLKTIGSAGWLNDAFIDEGGFPVRRQELEPVFIRNGGIYIAYSTIMEGGALWGRNCLPYIMPPERSVNINTAWDFEVAEMVAEKRFA